MTLELNRIYCGDCLDLMREIEPESIDMVLTDPPYSTGGMMRADRMANVKTKYQGNDAKVEYLDFVGDNRDQRSYYFWSVLWISLALRTAKQGAIIGIFTDWRQLPTISDALQGGGWIWQGIAVWDKTEAARPQKGRFRNQCEYLVWGTKGPHVQQTLDCLPGVFKLSTLSEEKRHLTGKPVKLFEHLVKISRENATILDPFIGSGTTAIACKRLGRNYIGIEIVPENVPIIEERISNVPAPLDSFRVIA